MVKGQRQPTVQWLVWAMEEAVVKGKGLWADSLLDSLEGLTVTQAAWRPRPGVHSIWEIVNHVAFWKDAMVRGLERRPKADTSQHQGWPPVSEASEISWAGSIKYLMDRHQTLLACIRKLEDSNLDQPLPGEKQPLGENLFGVIAHDCYHTGQIIELRQSQGI